jgi:predicted transcriptional regulator
MTRKLDKEHLDEIMELRDAFTKNSQTLGNIYLEEYALKQRFDMLDAERSKFIQQFSDLQKQEQELLEKMRERYGDGEINIAQGTFTPTA